MLDLFQELRTRLKTETKAAPMTLALACVRVLGALCQTGGQNLSIHKSCSTDCCNFLWKGLRSSVPGCRLKQSEHLFYRITGDNRQDNTYPLQKAMGCSFHKGFNYNLYKEHRELYPRTLPGILWSPICMTCVTLLNSRNYHSLVN